MGRNGVTFHDIAETVPKLIEQRKTPSIDNIREYLGTGSKSTIAKLLREWKAQQGMRPEKANDKIDTLRHELQFISQEKANLEGQLKQLQAMLAGRLS